jgi:RHS repeat-associated protein
VVDPPLPVAGTPFTLNYSSDRTTTFNNILVIPLTGASVPADLAEVDLRVTVAGREFTQAFSPGPDLSYTFVWDGKDAYGRQVQGAQPVNVLVRYGYHATYGAIQNNIQFRAFGNYSPFTASDRTRQLVYLGQTWKGTLIGGWDARGAGLGGWTLDVQQQYDPVARELYQGDGERRGAEGQGAIITTVAGNGIRGSTGDGGPATQAQLAVPEDITVAPDGSLLIHEWDTARTRRVAPDGTITTLPSLPVPWPNGGMVAAKDGSIYFTGGGWDNQVHRLWPDGTVTTVAGSGSSGYSGDGGPATQAQLNDPWRLALGPDGSLYIADVLNQRIRRVGPDGIITTVAGNGPGTGGYSGDGGPAIQAQLNVPTGIAVGPDGSLYIADSRNHRIRRVGPDGIITTFAGNSTEWDWRNATLIGGYSGDGGPATLALLNAPSDVEVGRDGQVYINDSTYNYRVRMVAPNGIITTIAGNGSLYGSGGDGGPATQAPIGYISGLALGPEGTLYLSESSNYVVRALVPSLPGTTVGEFTVASGDGSELYVFDASGQHLRTLDALTGAVLYRFTYDAARRLAQVEDVAGNVTRIERDAGGNPTAIVAPNGQRTALAVDANGYLADVTDPAGGSTQLRTTNDGLLTALTDPRGNTYHFAYDSAGRLTRENDPAGGFKTLARTNQADGYTVAETTPRGTTTYQVENLPTGEQRRTTTFPGVGAPGVTLIGPDGSRTITAPDGTVTKVVYGPDPRFGMEAPVATSLTVTTPAGTTLTAAETRTASLSNANEPLSLTTLTDTLTINGRVYTTTYNAAQHTLTATTPAGRQAVTTLNALGQVASVQFPGQGLIQLTYDSEGRPQTMTQGARTQTWTYDTQGDLTSITNALGQTVQFGNFDPDGRAGTETLPDGSVIQFAYDANGNVTALTPPGQPATDFTYTPVGQTAQYIPPAVPGSGTNLTSYVYTLCGLLKQIDLPDGTTVALGHDTTGHLTSVMQPRGQTTFAYDPGSGRLVTVTAPDGGTLSGGYDGGLLTDTTWAGSVAGSVHRTFDNNLRVTSASVNGADTVNYQYDQDGLLTGAGDLALTYDAQSGLLTGTTLGRVSDALTYDSFDELASYAASLDGAAFFADALTYDNLGRITEKTETINGTPHTYDYSYDLQGRLTDVRTDGVLTAHYDYDANGNRLAYTSPGGTVNGTYDDQDRLLTYGTTSYTYTATGALQSKTDTATGQTTTYTYDALGNLTGVTLPDGRQVEYLTDGLNRRIGVKVNGTLVQGLLYGAGSQPIAELDGNNNVVSRFVYGSKSNVPDYMIKGGKTYRLISDQLGSVRMVIDMATREVVQRLDYDDFGRVILDTNPGFQPFGFAGGIYDRNTGLVRFGARDYDAETGRWTTKDPGGFGGGSTNLYAYALNDPTNLVDLTGAEPTPPWNPLGYGEWPGSGVQQYQNAKFWEELLRQFIDENLPPWEPQPTSPAPTTPPWEPQPTCPAPTPQLPPGMPPIPPDAKEPDDVVDVDPKDLWPEDMPEIPPDAKKIPHYADPKVQQAYEEFLYRQEQGVQRGPGMPGLPVVPGLSGGLPAFPGIRVPIPWGLQPAFAF